MAGTSNITGDESIIFADNVSFDGTERGGKLTTNGQLLVGSTSSPHIKVGTLTSPNGSLTFGYSSPNITAQVTNDLHVAKWIVNPISNQGGNSSTIQNAINQAQPGDTIFVYPGTYTENLSLKAGVNITSFGSEYQGTTTSQVTIVGKMTATFTGTVAISGVTLQTNSDYVIESTGSNTGTIRLTNCNLFANNNSLIHSTNANFTCLLYYCIYVINTTGITPAVFTGGNLAFFFCRGQNPGLSTTASTFADAVFTGLYSEMQTPITTSATGAVSLKYCIINNGGTNATCITAGGSGNNIAEFCEFNSGTASSISISATMTVTSSLINSSNTNAITGAGTILYSGINFVGTSSIINTTTQTPFYLNLGKFKATGQPNFFALKSSNSTNATGNGATFTVVCDSVSYDLNSNYNNSTGTFTAPVAGKYAFHGSVYITNCTVANVANIIFTTTGAQFNLPITRPAGSTDFQVANTIFCNMAAGDTCVLKILVTGEAGNTDTVLGGAGNVATHFTGYLIG